MSKNEDDPFFGIIRTQFTTTEIEKLSFDNSLDEAYTLERLEFGREHLLEAFHILLDGLHRQKSETERLQLTSQFGNAVIPSLGIRPGDEVLVNNPQVFLDENGPGVVFYNDQVRGNFAGLVPYNLFFVDAGDFSGEVEPELTPTGELGLYIVLANAKIDMTDERIPLLGKSLVSLSNGVPELYHVHRK